LLISLLMSTMECLVCNTNQILRVFILLINKNNCFETAADNKELFIGYLYMYIRNYVSIQFYS